MSADLVVATEDFAAVLPVHQQHLAGYSFVEGQRYAEFRPGDQIAKIGLTGLIVGGAGVAPAKSGFLVKFIKPILIAIIAFLGVIGRRLLDVARRLTGRDEGVPSA